jgi:endonuclease YncB( thermonuclease family)
VKQLIILILLLAPVISYAGDKTYGDAVVVDVLSVYDGDTFRVNIKGYPDIIGSNIPIRISNIDTPEMNDKDKKVRVLAQDAKVFTYLILRKGKLIELRNIRRGKYFRIVAEVYVDGVSLGDELLKAGLARKWK